MYNGIFKALLTVDRYMYERQSSKNYMAIRQITVTPH